MQAVEMNNAQVRTFLQFLLDEKRIALYDKGGCILSNRYVLVDSSPIPNRHSRRRSRRPKVLQRVWNTCRIMKVFSIFDLRSTACAGEVTTRRYIRALERARLVRRVNIDDDEVYRLNVNTGPVHPVVTDDGMHCPNRGVFYPFKEDS
ncbi:hypothetical protein [Photobacterium nomapromontoriensis]|uniref:hypothetical protein n=1 Tax=Photobacterium nomapromontoriensis TaxID=2910237 RepID=UPI003D0CF975